MLDEITAQRGTAMHRETQGRVHDRHGFIVASELLDRDGEDIAFEWLREHEALPWHSGAQCPMRADAAT